MAHGTVTCPGCGASTPVPDDLQQAAFPCAACGRALRTTDVVGEAVVVADAFVAQVKAVLAGDAAAPTARPLDGRPADDRPGTCIYCKAPVSVPMALRVHELTCPTCGKVQPVAAHVSDADRLRADLDKQVAENAALKALRASGTDCPRCGAHVDFPPAGVQGTCGHCGAAVLLSALVGPDALAREALGTGVRGAIDGAVRAQESRKRRVDGLILGGIAVVVVLVVGGLVCSSVAGTLVAAVGLR